MKKYKIIKEDIFEVINWLEQRDKRQFLINKTMLKTVKGYHWQGYMRDDWNIGYLDLYKHFILKPRIRYIREINLTP